MKNNEFKYLTNDELMTVDGGGWIFVALGLATAGSFVAGIVHSWLKD